MEIILNQIEDINESIRKYAVAAADAILAKKDAEFSSISQDMILAAHHCYSQFEEELKNIVYDTCYDLYENKMGREKIAGNFYNNAIKCCKSFLN